MDDNENRRRVLELAVNAMKQVGSSPKDIEYLQAELDSVNQSTNAHLSPRSLAGGVAELQVRRTELVRDRMTQMDDMFASLVESRETLDRPPVPLNSSVIFQMAEREVTYARERKTFARSMQTLEGLHQARVDQVNTLKAEIKLARGDVDLSALAQKTQELEQRIAAVSDGAARAKSIGTPGVNRKEKVRW